MRTVAYDLDGTLFSIKQCIEMFNKLKNKNYKLEDIVKYNFGYLYDMSEEEYLETWIQLSEKIVTESKINKKMLENLHSEKEKGSRIIIVTARDKKLDRLNEEILYKNGILFDAYYSDNLEKYSVLKQEKVNRFFDDRGELIHNLMETDLEESCELTLVDAPYNQEFKSHNRFYL